MSASLIKCSWMMMADASLVRYYYMQHRAHEAETTTVPGLSDLGPSFLSLDVDGRVVRLDTFSKCLAPGFRLGWVSAPKGFVLKLDGVQYFSSQWGSTFSMMVG